MTLQEKTEKKLKELDEINFDKNKSRAIIYRK